MYTLVDEHWVDFAAVRNEALLAEADRDSRRAIALDETATLMHGMPANGCC